MQERGRERRQRDHAEQQESGGRREEAVERIGRIDIRIRDGGADSGENARNVRARQAGNAAHPLAPPRPFAGRDQRDRQQRAEHYAHARTDEALLDR
jgi:hypothetical protein